MSDLRPCPYCGKTNPLCRYWREEEELWELYGAYPEDLLKIWSLLSHWNIRHFPYVEDEEELMSYITEAAVSCTRCGARVYGTIDKTDGEYDFIRRWNRRVNE